MADESRGSRLEAERTKAVYPADAPWLGIYEPHVPAKVATPFASMADLFEDTVSRYPDSPALLYFDETVTYAELDRRADKLASWLADRGVTNGDRVQIVAQNVPAFPLSCVAAWKLGAIPVPGNPMYRSAELARIFQNSDPAAVICQEAEAQEVLLGLEGAGLAHVPLVVVNPRSGVGDEPAGLFPPIAVSAPGTRLEEILAGARDGIGRPPQTGPSDVGLILYTSGTTGVPKGAMLTHASMVFNSETTRLWFSLDHNHRILAIAPLFHITGLICHLAVAFRAGCALVMNYRFEPRTVAAMIRRHRPTFTIGAITAFNALTGLDDISQADMASLTKVWSGGAPIPPALRRRIQGKFGFTINNSYGMTELTSPVVLTPHDADAPERDGSLSLGIPIPSTELRVIDETGAVLPAGQAGELLFRGPQVMAGYWRRPDETADALVDGWMHTGDVGFMDEDGWVYLVDRKKDCIIASGFKVWPREVEDVLHEHPAVREAAVIGIPDDYRGETVKACVSFKTGHSASASDLVAHCRERLAAYKVPRSVNILDELPKTVTGKIQRSALRERSAP